MNAPKFRLPILAAVLLALTGVPRGLVAQTVVLPPAQPAAGPPDGGDEAAAETAPEAAPEAPVDVAAEPAAVEAAPAAPGEAAPGEEPEPVVEGRGSPPGAAGEPVPGDDSGDGAAPTSEEARARKEQEMRELEPLPDRPVNKEEDAFLPVSYSPQRYAPTWSDSAFTREIVPEVVVGEEVVNELDKYVLTGIGTVGGAYFVTSLSPKNEPEIIRTEPKKPGGLFVVSVERAAKMSDSVVTISDGTSTGRIKFDSKRLSAPPKAAVALNTGGVQGGRAPINTVGAGAAGNPQQAQQQQQQQAQAVAQAVAQQQAQQAQQAQAQLTPQQQQEQAAAQQQASEQLIQHLRAASQNPAAAAPAQGNADGNQPRKRRVILPPPGGR